MDIYIYIHICNPFNAYLVITITVANEVIPYSDIPLFKKGQKIP